MEINWWSNQGGSGQGAASWVDEGHPETWCWESTDGLECILSAQTFLLGNRGKQWRKLLRNSSCQQRHWGAGKVESGQGQVEILEKIWAKKSCVPRTCTDCYYWLLKSTWFGYVVIVLESPEIDISWWNVKDIYIGWIKTFATVNV